MMIHLRVLSLGLALLVSSVAFEARAEDSIKVVNDDGGSRLIVNDRPMMIRGMNWDYVPVGENYAYSLWERPESEIERVLTRDMTLLRDMHVNVIRVYVGMPAKWIRWVHERFGIYTMVNHTAGRYGLTIDGGWHPVTDYSDPKTRRFLMEDVIRMVEQYRGTPGLLMYLLGNENNYGLYWESAAIADLPLDKQADARAEHLYSLYGELIHALKQRDANHPVAIANGDLQFIDLIAKHCPELDVLGANVYRGRSARDLFDVVREKLGKPFVYTEFGADAFDAKHQREDDATQASYLRDQWREIDEQSHGKGRAGNAIGGFVFQWADGWWKHLQEAQLDVHDRTASWANGGYPEDLEDGENNMNEEWWGIMARGPTRPGELSPLYPRAAYFLLADGFALDPYSVDGEAVRKHWNALDPRAYARQSAAERVSSGSLETAAPIRLIDGALELQSISSGGRGLDDPQRQLTRTGHMESAYLGVEVNPLPNVRGQVTFNVLGNVPPNPIDQIFFENRKTGPVKLYQGSFDWHDKWFDLSAFHRVGHYHWGYEGDFFALYPEANYQRSVDTFNADAPSGAVVAGRRALEGLKIAFGPELYWGANPAIIAKYHRRSGPFEWSVMHQQDVSQRVDMATSSALPMPQTQKSTLYVGWTKGGLKLEWGGIAAGADRLGRRYSIATPTTGPSYLESGYWVLDDVIRWYDMLGTKLKATLHAGRFNAYAQGGYRGLVADSMPDQTINLTGFRLRESGQGNHFHAISGAAYNVTSSFLVAPNLLFQKPLVGPLPVVSDFVDAATGNYYAGLQGRNQLQDPFWVRSNRETLGAELLFVYDPTPATWFWQWNNAQKEDAPFAGSLDLSYRHLPTGMDGGLGVLASGAVFAFPNSVPAQDLYELWARFVLNRGAAHLAGAAWAGTGQANGNDPRLVKRAGVEARLDVLRWSFSGFLKFHDWGPYDYHRDYNLTFPLQVYADAAWTADAPRWFFTNQTKIGASVKYRTLDEHSPRFDPVAGAVNGSNEWEVRTYVRLSI